jgi:CubicO group peptidase (beta-lactamase class C family)
MRVIGLLLVLCCVLRISAQNSLYFPPNMGNWDAIPPTTLGFCPDRVDSLYQFLAESDTKSFILLQDGRIVLERYFGTYTQDSLWYWASAGKSLTALLVGQAKDEGLLALNDPTSQYLGAGWTSCPPEKESLITIRHQLSMTSGLDDGVADDNCVDPACLNYLADAGTRWAYHNGVYHLLHDVIEEASGLSLQQFTKTRLLDPIGMKGFWFNHIQYGRARDMARFGLLMLAGGIWNGDTLLHDAMYFDQMTHPSQDLNEGYGYLWWLNGQNSFMLPSLQIVFNGTLIPNAPSDAYAALGKNDQKIHVVPSKGWVIVRQGNSANAGLVPITFDNELWAHLNDLVCLNSTTDQVSASDLKVVSVAAGGGWQVTCRRQPQRLMLLQLDGRVIYTCDGADTFIPNAHLPSGVYLLQAAGQQGTQTLKLVKSE